MNTLAITEERIEEIRGKAIIQEYLRAKFPGTFVMCFKNGNALILGDGVDLECRPIIIGGEVMDLKIIKIEFLKPVSDLLLPFIMNYAE